MGKEEVYRCDLCRKVAPIHHADAADYMILHGVRVKRTWEKKAEEREGSDFHRVICPQCMETVEQILEALEKQFGSE